MQLLSFEHNEGLYLLINIYNNNIEAEQVEALKKLDALLEKFGNITGHTIVIGGDFNFIQDIILDSSGGNPRLKLNSIAELLKTKQKYDLCDIFRVRKPLEKQFTFKKKLNLPGGD